VNEQTYNLHCENATGERLDVFVASRLPDISRSYVRKLIDGGHVRVDGNTARAGYRLSAGEDVQVTIPPVEPTDIRAEDIPLDVRYEDDQLLVINKAKGMTVHPAPGSLTGTLVNAVLAHTDDLSGIGGEERPGIVHRLDKDTSGLLVVAKSDLAHAALQKQIQDRSAERLYVALVWGETKFNEALVDAPIGRHPTDRQKMSIIRDTDRYTARKAVTHLRVMERFPGFTLLEAKLDTGRTHQIRVHCSFIGHPVVGDPVYGGLKRSIPGGYSKSAQVEISRLIHDLHGQALHARMLSFNHPVTGERLSFEAEMPKDMADLIGRLRIR
jgi:23S rRNA pseudouridine1911/1915/1917 synthase